MAQPHEGSIPFIGVTSLCETGAPWGAGGGVNFLSQKGDGGKAGAEGKNLLKQLTVL